MKVMLLEIDARLKEILMPKLSDAGMLAMSLHKKRNEKECSLFDELEQGRSIEGDEGNSLEVEVFAESEAFAKITKSIVRLARDGFLAKFPVKVMSVRSVI
ncbi:MAG: hypothetical protein KQH63_20370 [Desulfobulbaceae bacterium]|nr:hypothetical protein [Desulfobulbaceae bacterium]